jgi:hypothetical protein
MTESILKHLQKCHTAMYRAARGRNGFSPTNAKFSPKSELSNALRHALEKINFNSTINLNSHP